MKPIVRILTLTCIILFSTVNLYSQCTADFKIQNTTCNGTTVLFKATDSSKTIKFSWNFGDVFSGPDNVDTLANPSHLFTGAGTFTITLIVNDTNGCRDTFAKTITVFAKPKAGFTWSDGCSNMKTVFTNASNSGSGDSLIEWKWDFGNSVKSTAKDTQTSFSSPGNYNVQLIVVSAEGCTDTLRKTIVIYKKPTGASDVLKECKNEVINFLADTLSGALTYTWDFGDSSFFTLRSVSHVYKKTGYIYPFLTVDFGSTKCKIAIDSILIHPLPDASFIVLNDTQCFSQNNVCVKLTNNSQKLKSRTVIFDDGFYDDTTPLSDSIVCHKYTDTKGGAYYLTMELVDSNNCLSSYTLTRPVVIYPEIIADYDLTVGTGCFKTNVFIDNTSNETPPQVTSFLWDFGDGGKDSTTWDNVNYTYTAAGTFSITLLIKNKEGCTATYTDLKTVTNTSFVVDATMDSSSGKCRNDNYYHFNQTYIPGASIQWRFSAIGGASNFSTQYSFPDPGLYFPTVTISKNGCDSTIMLDSIVVHGPAAYIGNIVNRYQCQVKDTVYYQNASIMFRNVGLQAYWDAGDPFAPNCTLITKESVNVNQNCRYSKDSLYYKHMFGKGKEACYRTKLVVIDSIVGCRDSAYVYIPLMAPQAKGLFTPSITSPCPGPESFKSLTFNLNQSQPSCLKYAWWLMWDSLAAERTGNFDSNWVFNSRFYNYNYTKYAGDSSGNVTIGLIVENGLDTNGKVCRDTGWFHHTVSVTRMSPIFSTNYNPKNYYCFNSGFRFFPKDSNQTAGSRFYWNFGDGSYFDTSSQLSVYHVFKKAGKYLVSLTVQNPNGCWGDTSMWLNIGVYKNFNASSNLLCIRDSIQLFESNRYYDTITGAYSYWSDPLRASAGKEQVLYDLGDSNGFQDLGPNPKIGYPYPGIYKISMAVKDSAGCWDTLANYQTISVSGVYANFKLPSDSMLCAQTLDLKSLSSTVDSTVMKGLAGDYVKTWEWDLGTAYAKIFIPNPKRFFAIGDYIIKLKVTNAYGCKDSITRSLVLIGPKAHYDFVGDSVGCEPLKVTFKNSSIFASNYIWQFKDISNSTFGTGSDTNVSFKYKGKGNFYPQLIARGLFTKNGVSRVCDDVYPDTSLSFRRTVTVWELPKPKFTWYTNCSNSTTTFTNTSTISTGSIVFATWYFGDGTSSSAPNPTHTYSDTGYYRVVLKVISDKGCEDSIVRTVVVSMAPFADFGFNRSCLGSQSLFKDSSFAFNDRIYLWRWDFGDGTGSTLKNPGKLYALDTTYLVKLKVTNVAGCSDSIEKLYTVHTNPKPDFSFSNVCDQSIMTFTNNSSSKEALQNWAWSFGDGNGSASWGTSHTFAGPANYTVKLKLLTIWGCKDSSLKTVTVYPNPVAEIDINQKDQCFKYHSFLLSDSSKILSGTTTSQWDLGNGDSSSQSGFSYRYAAYGKYGIRLISISGFNCRDTVYDSVRVFTMPVVRFSINQYNQCSRYNLYTFSDSGSIAVGTFTRLWEFGDGNSSVSNPATHHYLDTGFYQPRLILTSDLGCKDTAEEVVRLWPMPKAGFAINDSMQCLNDNIFIYTNTSTVAWGGLTAGWEFGDDSISNATNATHSYDSSGNYDVLLEETSINNCKDTIIKTVVVYPMPLTSYIIDDSLQCLTGNSFKFTNNSTISSGSLSYKWYFGDGNTSVQVNPQHSYSNFGTYTVKLVTLSASGCLDSVSQVIIVYPMPLVKPLVNLNNGCINAQNFQFTDSSSISYGNLSRTWKFGDSTTSSLINPNKIFPYANTYKVWLIEVSDFGCNDSSSLSVQIYPKPNVAFTTNDTDQCLNGNSFSFTNKSTLQSGTFTQTWRFGDGSSLPTYSPTHFYGNFGTFTVDLVAISNFGCKDSALATMVVYPMPVPMFATNKNEQCLKLNKFIFTNNSTIATGSLTHAWKFGDTGVSVVASPTYIYNSIGGFRVVLKSTSLFGCVDSAFDFVTVNPMPAIGFSINDTTQCLNSQNFIFKDSSKIAYGTLTRKWVFDEGPNSGLATVNKQFVMDTVHVVKLVQTSDRGCFDSLSKQFEVYSKPIPSYTINDTDQCMKQNNFVFVNGSAIKKGSLTYLWKFGDNTSNTNANTSHRYFAWGNYTVTLIATSENGCIDSLKKPVRVDPMPAVSFNVNDTGQCVNNQSYVFKNNSTIPVGTLQHLWKFGDGNTSTVIDPIHKYLVDSFYTVLLTETSNKGCMDSIEKVMAVYPKPSGNFDIDDSIQCLYLNDFNFTNKASIKYGSLTYNWNFGDGNTATSTDANHSYAVYGNYLVVLRSLSDLGCRDSFSKIITVAAMPKVNYSVNDPGQCFRIQNFVFTNKSSLVLGSMSSKWHFGDLDTLTSLNASHVYKAIGNYQPKLVMTTNYGCKDSISYSIRVNPNAKTSFTVNDSDQCINQQNYLFTNTSTVTPGQIKSLLWSLGNGKTATQQQVTGVYPKSGTYTIILQTTTDSGCVDSFSNRIRIYPKPIAWFDVNDSAQCLFQNDYEFTDNSFDSLGVNQYNWDINGESQQTTNVATYIFSSSGYKTINLIVTSMRGCGDTVQRQVYVKPMPDPTFEPLKKYYCELTGPYTFAPVTPGGTFYGKNIQSNIYNPVILWLDTVKYIVTVNGCTDSSMQLTNVYPGPVVDLGNDTTICKYEVLELIVNSWQSKIIWNDGSIGPYFRVTEPGTYWVTATNICGVKSDTIQVDYRDVNCRFFIPTAFSPNSDGINDRFKPVLYDVGDMKYQIFNRWGEQLYEGNENDLGWDGTYRGEMVQVDNYLVHVTYTYTSSFHYIKITESGMFILVR